jgi:C4-dicarboxylate-specific signal transduction histidine kinase
MKRGCTVATRGTGALARHGVALTITAVALELTLIGVVLVQRRNRRRVEVSLQESEERISLATLPENLGLWEWSATADSIWATAHFCTILDLPASGRITPSVVRQRIHPDDRTIFDDAFARAGNGEVVESDFRTIRANGEIRWICGKARARRNAVGRVVRVTGVIIDETERKQAVVERQYQRLQLSHLTRVAMLGQLSGAIAHELTQPVTAILSNAQAGRRLLAANDVDLKEIRAILDDIVRDDRRAGDVIQRLRALLKRGETEVQLLDVRQVIREVLALTHSELIARDVEVECAFDADLPAVPMDRVQIQQVILNLLMNAMDAMTANEPRDRRARILATRDTDFLRISVEDRGTGLDAAGVETIFDAFVTTKPDGLGLGLSICRSIVSAHGGQLSVVNNTSRGCTFRFTLPLGGCGKERS